MSFLWKGNVTQIRGRRPLYVATFQVLKTPFYFMALPITTFVGVFFGRNGEKYNRDVGVITLPVDNNIFFKFSGLRLEAVLELKSAWSVPTRRLPCLHVGPQVEWEMSVCAPTKKVEKGKCGMLNQQLDRSKPIVL